MSDAVLITLVICGTLLALAGLVTAIGVWSQHRERTNQTKTTHQPERGPRP